MRFITPEQRNILLSQEFTHVFGFDTEYEKEIVELEIKTEDEETACVKEIEKNKILSYQLNCNSLETGTEKDLIIYTKTLKPRLTLNELLQSGMQALNEPFKKTKILLIAHFGVAEWSALEDRTALKEKVTLVRGCPVTLRPLKLGSKNVVVWRDTLLLSPTGEGSLAALGKLTNTQKVEISQDYKENMSRLLAENKPLYEKYSITDTHVTTAYYMQVMEEATKVCGKPMCPLTIGGISTEAFVQSYGGQEAFEDIFRGRNAIKDINEKGEEVVKYEKSMEFLSTEPLAAGAYVGGMNTAFVLGETKKGQTIIDIDFSSAYPSAMSSLPLVDFNQFAKKTKNLTALANSDISFADILYEFPDNDVSKCCIPAATEFGLTYPKSGNARCTGAELKLALRNGAKIKVLNGIILQTTDQKAFADFLKTSVQTRERYKKAGDKFRDKFYKEYNNSLYGKVAQAVRAKTGRDWTGKRQELKESRVSQPVYAAYITALVRVALFELIDTLKNEYKAEVLSATTDGCMTAVNGKRKDSLEAYFPGIFDKLVKIGGACAKLNTGRVAMGFQSHSFLEIKKTADKAITAKTRVNVMFDEKEGQKVLVGKAMAGVHEIKPLELLEHMHLNKIEKQSKKSLSGAKKIVETDKLAEKLEKGNKELFVPDLVKVNRVSTVSLDPDFKNRISGEGVCGEAWDKLEDMRKARKAATRIRKKGQRATPAAVLTTMEGIKLAGGLKTTVLRQVLRLCKGKVGNWHFNRKTYKEIATMFGVKEQMVHDSTRKALFMQKLPYTLETETILNEIAEGFGLDLTVQMIMAACMATISKKTIANELRILWQAGKLDNLKKETIVEKLKVLDDEIDYNFVRNACRNGEVKKLADTDSVFTVNQLHKMLGLR